jgi:hypothetical protein
LYEIECADYVEYLYGTTHLHLYLCIYTYQVVEVTPPGTATITIANVYDYSREGARPTQRVNWSAIAKSARAIAAGIIIAHSTGMEERRDERTKSSGRN